MKQIMTFDANAISTMIQSMDGSDLLATAIFICSAGSYCLFLFIMNRFHKENLPQSILQKYRLAWVKNHGAIQPLYMMYPKTLPY